jgi:hypothetical protein
MGGDIVHEMHIGGLMLVIREPGRGSDCHTVEIGDTSDVESFVPRHSFGWTELPIVGRLLNTAYFWIYQNQDR